MPLAPDPGHALLNPAREQPIILLAEGEQRTGDLLLNYLENAGYAVVRAASLTKSLQLAKEIKPNAVILDLLRPDAAGWRVLRELKLQPETANIPVIVASVLDDDDDSRSLGAAAYLTKPVSKKLLLDTLRRLALDTGAEPGPVMVVDDELAARDLLREILLSNGHKALLACNGREALEQLRTVKPCAIVLDLLMPEMDGLTFLFAMKRNPQWATIPVIVLTGKELSANDIQLLKQTSTAILLKGTSWKQQLLEALRRTIAESHV